MMTYILVASKNRRDRQLVCHKNAFNLDGPILDGQADLITNSRRKAKNIEIVAQRLDRVMRNPTFCICENKGADQLRSNCAADQCLYFCFINSSMPVLSKFKISSL